MNKLDHDIAVLAGELDSLSSRARAAFFAACGHGLRPYYVDFVAHHDWGEVKVLDEALAVARRFAHGEDPEPAPNLLDRLEAATPHSDDFDAPDPADAQDAIICADVAVRCATGAAVDMQAVYYAIEPMLTALGEADDSETEDQWRNRVPNLPEMQRAFGFCRSALETLAGRDVIDETEMASLESSAHLLRPDGSDVGE